MGRPKLYDGRTINLRVDSETRTELIRAAKKAKMTVPSMLRYMVRHYTLAVEIKPREPQQA